MTLPANVERFLFEVSGADEELRVVRFEGKEGLSQLFKVDLELVAEDSELNFEQFIGQAGLLTVLSDDEPRYFHGIVNRFEQGATGRRFTTYYATLVPKIEPLCHRYNCRIFQDMSARDIVQKILKELGLPGDEYRFVLQSPPPKREYCVQYRESDLNFICRLLEYEGIFYFFEHHNNKHILVMGNSLSAHAPIPGKNQVIFHPPTTLVAEEQHILSFNYTQEILSGKVSLKDFNFEKPALNLKGEKAADKDTELEVYDYPGIFDDRNDFNKKYLITQHVMSASQPQVLEEEAGTKKPSYSSRFECIPFDTPYRPASVTPKPVVKGSQTAIVVGPKGEEIYTDKHGRVKVQFHWDREGKRDEKSSCWIRVSQFWAGARWGAMFIPRIDHEVIVDFLEGDPDRPIITGRVYHGTNLPPYQLPQEKTKSTVKSNSSKGGNGSNEIRFEDKKGKEEVWIHAQKDMNTVVGNNRTATVTKDEKLTVEEGDRTIAVSKGQEKHTIKKDYIIQVDGNLTIDVNGSINIKSKTKSVTIKAAQSLTNKAGTSLTNKAGTSLTNQAGASLTNKANASLTNQAGATLTSKANGLQKVEAGGLVIVKGALVKIN
jgi:type VI secretion system secreted protein VgrG